jgi:small GTP-binding protein
MAKLIKEGGNQYDMLLKVIIIGDSGVGKSNILMKFSDSEFKTSYTPTIGVDFKIKSLSMQGKRIKFQIWDTAGQERYRTITQTYYKGAHGVVLVYSIADRKSFESVGRTCLIQRAGCAKSRSTAPVPSRSS